MTIGCRHADSQRTGRGCLLPRRFPLRIREVTQCLSTLFKVPLSQVRHPDLPRGSDEQLYAEAFLKTRHRTADRSRIDACGRSGGRETSQFSRQTEQFDTAQQETFKLTLHTLSMT